MRYKLFYLLVGSIFSISCNERSILKNSDYAVYLDPTIINAQVDAAGREKNFWSDRLKVDTGSYISKLELAKNELLLFKLTGNIQSLHKGDSLLVNASGKLGNTDPELLFALSHNSITQHRFRRAAYLNSHAEKMQGDLYAVRLLQFDAWMELGRYGDAYKSLQSLKNRSSFDYLVRKAKWEDHNGRLGEAILLMERALELVRSDKRSNYTWALSNLADMYGHAGRIQDSYNAYLEVLALEPGNLYCLKGIAWIAYSYEKNYAEAKRIWRFILSQAEMPDLKLLLAEIAEMENDLSTANKWKADFIADVTRPGYGNMYNKYLIELFSASKEDKDKAIALAKREIRERFTVETCDLLAWAYYQSGAPDAALKISEAYVAGRSFEPIILMHSAFIKAANDKKEEARILLEECLESSFELGPSATREIKEKLAALNN
jgi:hypothetical protein